MAHAQAMCDALGTLLASAYGRAPTPEDFERQTWAVLLSDNGTGEAAAGCTLAFFIDSPCFFRTRLEAVRPDQQRTGVGRLLFDCVKAWTRFLVSVDPLVSTCVLESSGLYHIVSFVDSDDERGRGFMQGLGFARTRHDKGQNEDYEEAYQLALSVPILVEA